MAAGMHAQAAITVPTWMGKEHLGDASRARRVSHLQLRALADQRSAAGISRCSAGQVHRRGLVQLAACIAKDWCGRCSAAQVHWRGLVQLAACSANHRRRRRLEHHNMLLRPSSGGIRVTSAVSMGCAVRCILPDSSRHLQKTLSLVSRTVAWFLPWLQGARSPGEDREGLCWACSAG